MSNYADDSGKRPLIPLRIPASLLSTLSSESRIKLNHNNDNGGVESLTVTQSKSIKDKQQETTYPLEATNSKQSTDWYTSTANTITADSSLSTSNKKELQHIGTSTKQYTIKISKPKSNNIKQNVKEIGKRTRRLLEEERAKRKEIVRLDYDTNNKELCLPPLPEEKAAAAAEKQQQQQSTEKIKASQNKSTKLTTTIRKRKRKVASNIDGYMPNVDHLLLPTDTTTAISKDDYSNIIRLHGLPINIKPEHIFKFFHGLNPSLIFILPPFDCYIQGWDAIANNDNGEEKKNTTTTSSSILVERHANNFRVYVKFTSSLVANAAIERMGESIGLADRGGDDGSIVQCGKREIVGASIAMSPVPKHVALFLQKYMAIHTRKGESIIDTLTKIEQQLDTVTQMSWIMAVEKLKLKQQIRRKGRSSSKTSSSNISNNNLDHLSQSYNIPENKVQYQQLTKLYNQLVETHEKLELDCGILFYTFDPSLVEDSAHRIVASVSNWLLNKIENINRVLRESRQRLEL